MIQSDKILQLITELIEAGASDIHIYSNSVACYRLYGQFKFAGEYGVIPQKEVLGLINDLTDDYQKSKFYSEELIDIDFGADIPGSSRVRVNVYTQLTGEAVILRVIPTRVPTMQELRLPLVAEDLARNKSGLVLVTGRARHGKSTTVSSMIEMINSEFPYNIITIENPIEFVFTPKKSRINQRQIGFHVCNFPHAIQSTLNEDPDVVYIGEIKDMETASMVLRLAETGPLVIATLHTRTATETIDRYVNFFPEEHRSTIRNLLADTVRGIISQTLVRRKDGNGQILAYEILMGTIAVANLIREDKTKLLYSTMQTSGEDRMCTLDDTLKRLHLEGHITSEDAYKMCTDKKRFEYVMKDYGQQGKRR